LSPEDFDRYNDANDDFPVTIPPHLYLGDWDCEIDIWKIIPYSDTNFDWPRDETGEPIGPNLPGDRANRKIKLQEILQCFRRFYASVLAQQGEHTLNWDLNNPCCSIANLNKMMTIMRLFACLSTITEGNIPHAAGGTRIISDKLRQKMIKCINCIDKKCQLA
jgi:hypothetical protein